MSKINYPVSDSRSLNQHWLLIPDGPNFLLASCGSLLCNPILQRPPQKTFWLLFRRANFSKEENSHVQKVTQESCSQRNQFNERKIRFYKINMDQRDWVLGFEAQTMLSGNNSSKGEQDWLQGIAQWKRSCFTCMKLCALSAALGVGAQTETRDGWRVNETLSNKNNLWANLVQTR